jgi:hypothetical protein
MASWRRFQPRVIDVEALRDTGTKWERGGGFPFNWVGGQPPRQEYEGRASALLKFRGVDSREKLGGESMRRPYRKPTQVGEASSLR